MATSIDVINSAADSTMSPDQRDLFDQFGDDTKQRFLNQILKRVAVPELIGALRGLANECELAGHGTDKDYDWPKWMKAARDAITKASPS